VENAPTRQHDLRISVGTLTTSIEIINYDMIYGLFSFDEGGNRLDMMTTNRQSPLIIFSKKYVNYP
jgi:hypothetical protein